MALALQGQSEKVTLHFIAFPKVADPQPVELLIGETETIQVELPTNNISMAYQVPALKTWLLGESSGENGKEFNFNSYGQVASTGTRTQLILVTRKGQNNGEGLRLTALDYSDTGFHGGEYLFVNATMVDIAGIIGNEKFALKPSFHKIVAPKPTRKEGDRKYSYARFFFRNKETAKGFFSATWRINDRKRSTVFFYHDPHTKQIRLHIVRSFVSG
jgi:hypothetical protein